MTRGGHAIMAGKVCRGGRPTTPHLHYHHHHCDHVSVERRRGAGGSLAPPSPPQPPLQKTVVAVVAWLLMVTTMASWVPVSGEQRVPACQALYAGQQPVCSCAQTADGTDVSCAGRNPALTRVPSNLPQDTRVLNLANNNIVVLRKGDLIKVENLRTLFLQQNNLASIEEGAFDTLYNLQLLVLSGNLLTGVSSLWFQHLPSIRTIDLSNNQIQVVDRHAFFTVPASKSPSAVIIQLSGNSIHCDCEALALRDWSDGLSSTLTQIQFNGFQCANANGKELKSLRDDEFACSGATPPMFESDLQCITCRDQDTQQSCDNYRVAECGSQQPMCHSQVRVVNGKLKLYKGCGTYTQCLLRTQGNYPLCVVNHSAPIAFMDCEFCCVGDNCNTRDMGGRTLSFRLYVGVMMMQTYQRYMADPQDGRYQQKKNIFTQRINEIFGTLDGGFETSFLSFKNNSGNTYATCLVEVTTLNVHTVSSTGQRMTGALNVSLQTGFLREEQAVHVYVGTELVSTKRCPQEVTQTQFGTLTWPETPMAATTFVPCPLASVRPSGLHSYASRLCSTDGSGLATWAAPDLTACRRSDVTDRLEELDETEITPNNVDSVLTQLGELTSEGSELEPNDVTLAVDIAERALRQGGVLRSSTAMDNTLQVVSNILEAEGQVLASADRANQSATRLLAVTDTLAAEGQLGPDGQLLLTAPNVAVGALEVDSDRFLGATLTARPAMDYAFSPGDVQIEGKASSPPQDINSLVLPPTLLDDSSGSRVAMKALVSDKLFKAIQQSRRPVVSDSGGQSENEVRQVNTHVLDAAVVGQKISGLRDPVKMTFVHLNENASNPSCVFWDVRSVQWSSDGCSLAADLSGDTSTTCHCSHLTNFALLMDVYGAGGSLGERDKQILSIISYIGCGVSLLALLLTLLTYILFKSSFGSWSLSEPKLRRDNPSKILVNLCIALALSNLVFVAGMQPYALDSLVGCKIVAVLLHFSLLSALCWMAVEAFYMYLALVLVFKTYFTNFILKCSLIGWGIPLLTVAITLGVNETNNYGPLGTGVCWLKGLSFYVAFVAPVGLILVINLLAFGLVLRQILGLAERKLNKSDSFTPAQQLRGAVGVAILLGLTWLFALFAIDRASVVFYYLFAVFNSLQGLWIFVFYCLLKKEARNAWRRTLPCCRALDDKSLSHTRDKHDRYSDTRSAGYSGAVTKTERSKSSTDNGLTSTTAFTSSSMDSEGTNTNYPTKVGSTGKVDQEKPVPTEAVKPNQVHINLTADHNQNANHDPPSAGQPTRTVFRSEGNITLLATQPEGTQTAQQNHVAQNQPKPSPPEEKKGNGVDPAANLQPLRFKVGYTLSNTSTVSTDQSTLGPDDDSQLSVAERIKKINTRL